MLEAREIYRSDTIHAHFRPGRKSPILVVFEAAGLIGKENDHPRREFVDDDDFGVIIISARRRAWYPAQDTLPCIAAIRNEVGDTKLITYGASMGGYAAIKYAAALQATHVVALSPQFTINPLLIKTKSESFTVNFRPELNSGMEISSADVNCPVDIVFDPLHENDMEHVGLICRRIECRLTHVHHAGHGVEIIFGRRDIPKLIGFLLDGDLVSVKELIRRAKRQSANFHIQLYQSLADRKPAFARWSLTRAAKLPARTTDDRIGRSQALFKLGKVEAAAGELATAFDEAHRASSRWALAERLANISFAMQRKEDAVRWLRAAVENAPDDENAWSHLGTGLARAGKAVEAEQILTDVVKKHDTPLACFALSQALAAKGDTSAAIAAGLRAIAMSPMKHIWRGHLCALLSKSNRGAEAEALLYGAVRLFGDAGSWFEWSKFLRSTGRSEEALLAARRAVDLSPSNLGFRNHLAAILLQANRAEEAVLVCKDSIHSWFGNGSCRVQMAMALARLGQLDEAIRLIRQSIEDEPTIADHRAALVGLLLRANDIEGAVRADEEARQADCEPHAGLYAAQGRVRMLTGDFDGAIGLVDKAIQLAPDNLGLQGIRADYLLRADRLEDAAEAARRVIELGVAPKSGHQVLIKTLEQSGNVDGSVEACRQAIGAHPDDAGFRVKLANMLLSSGKVDETLAAINDALEDAVASDQLHAIRARVMLGRNDFVHALESARHAASMGPTNATNLGLLANCLLKAGFLEEAEKYARRAVELKPGVDWTNRFLAEVTRLRAVRQS